MDSRVLVGSWWELEAADGARAIEYSALGDTFGDSTTRRFDEDDLKPTKDITGRVYEDGLSTVGRVKQEHAGRGPFKLFKVRRYRLVKG